MTHLAVAPLLDSLPSGWEQVRFKAALERREARNVGAREPLLSLYSLGVVSLRSDGADRQRPAEDSIPRYLVVEPGDLVVNPMWLTGGAIGITGIRGAVSPDYRVFRSRGTVLPAYLHHLLRAAPFFDQYRLYARAETTFDRRVQQDDLDNLPLPVPPLEEQWRIADFLDDQVARIDHSIALRDQQLLLTQERLSAWLSREYQRLMEASGTVELRHVIRGIRQGWSPQCEDRLPEPGEWSVLKAGAVNDGVFRSEERKALREDLPPRSEFLLHPGDLLINRASGSLDLIGSAAVVPETVPASLLICDKLYQVKLIEERALAPFVAACLKSRPVREQIRLGVSGAEGMANSLPSGVIRSLLVPRVSIERQKHTVTRWQTALVHAGEVDSALSVSVALLRERKRALITATVTGKFDVSAASSRAADAAMARV